MKKILVGVLALMLYCCQSFAQSRQISGLVIDQTGVPVPHASVSVKGIDAGTKTDSSGVFKLALPEWKSVIIISAVGYNTQEKTVESNFVEITMVRSESKMDEVVITAFGQKQRKSDLVSSVTSINPKELRSPTNNLTAALQGKVAGVVSFQRSGEPGADNADFFIRGVGTFGANQRPLILLDNMEVSTEDLARIPLDDIENFSILRDATAAAVYGSRGANGVLLVTTKQGKDGPATIAIRAEQRVSTATQTLKFADPVTWMKMYNEAVLTRDPLGVEPYSQFKIEKTA